MLSHPILYLNAYIQVAFPDVSSPVAQGHADQKFLANRVLRRAFFSRCKTLGDFYKRDTCKSIFPAIGFEPTSERDRFIKDRTIMPAPAQDEMGIL